MENKNSLNYYWSCIPGKFVNRFTGKPVFEPKYEKILEVINVIELPGTPKRIIKIFEEKEIEIVPKQQMTFSSSISDWNATLASTVIEIVKSLERGTGYAVTKIMASKEAITFLADSQNFMYSNACQHNLKVWSDLTEPYTVVGMLSGLDVVFIDEPEYKDSIVIIAGEITNSTKATLKILDSHKDF